MLNVINLLIYISLSKYKLYGAYVKWLLYSTVNRSSMSLSMSLYGQSFSIACDVQTWPFKYRDGDGASFMTIKRQY